MSAPKGIAAIEWLARRTKEQRGGNAPQPDHFDRGAPDALALWRDAYLESLASRNYAEGTIEGRTFDLKFFLLWAEERELKQASPNHPPHPRKLPALPLALHPAQRPAPGLELRSASRLGTIKDFFRWLTRQDILMHNPASELEMPRMEKRLPGEALSLGEVERLLAVPDVSDPLGIRDRAMLELFYSTGMRRAELCRLELSDLHTERRTVHIRKGKGRKDRMVPIGQRAVLWVERYLREIRPRLCLDTRTQALFLTGYGGPFNPDVLSRMVTDWVEKAGLPQKGKLPFAPAHLRHAHAGKRGGHPLHPAVAGA